MFDKPLIHRCQQHKIRNVRDQLPQRAARGRGEADARGLPRRLGAGGRGRADRLAAELDTHPPRRRGQSLREGLAETLTVLRLGVPPTLARTLRSTNPIESMISICREHSKNVKRWRDGQMALRWCAAGMLEAEQQFRRVNGHLHLPTLRAALERAVRRECQCRQARMRRERGLMVTGAATEVPRNSGQPRCRGGSLFRLRSTTHHDGGIIPTL